MANVDDDLPPPPGGYMGDPGPAGPERAEQAALERMAEVLEGVREELGRIRQLLEQQQARR
jgi:hypothetical protein